MVDAIESDELENILQAHHWIEITKNDISKLEASLNSLNGPNEFEIRTKLVMFILPKVKKSPI